MIILFSILACLAFILFIIYALSKLKFNYWKVRNVPHLKPVPIFGNYSDYILLKKYAGYVTQTLCDKFADVPYFGTFYGTEPALIVHDPELLKVIMTKDFYYFSGREISKYTHKEVFTKNIFFSGGDRWRVVRQSLTPLFSSAKMKNMFHLLDKCSNEFETMLDEEIKMSNIFEVRALMAKYTMAVIGSAAFGINTRTMEISNEENRFRTIGSLIFANSSYRGFKLIARAMWPALFYGVGFKSFPDEINTFFHKLLVGIFEGRNYKPSGRNDFIDLILGFKENKYITGDSLENMKNGGGKKINLEVDDELLVAQCLTFFAAGYETSATTLSFTLYELAKNQEAQRKAQEEVDAFLKRHDNKLTYDCVNEMPFLDACVDEALRLYPVLGILTREVVDEYTMPSGLVLEKGLRVHVPVYALHHNPKHFPEPEKYIPERFLGENKKDIKPYTYFPFGEGPRICIGMRFARMNMLAALITFLKKFHVELAEEMPSSVCLEPRAIVTQPVDSGGIHLKWNLREGWENRLLKRT